MLLRDGKTSLKPVYEGGRRVKGRAVARDLGSDIETVMTRRPGPGKHVDIDLTRSASKVDHTIGGQRAPGGPAAFLRHARALGEAADRGGVTSHTYAQWFGKRPSKPGLSHDQSTSRLTSAYKKLGFKSNPQEKASLLKDMKDRGFSLRDRQEYSRYSLRPIEHLKRVPKPVRSRG